MWKSRPDEKPFTPNTQPGAASTGTPLVSANPAPASRDTRPLELNNSSEPFRPDVAAHIGKSVVVKGELSGSEDLYLDGEVEGTIDLKNHTLMVGPNGKIRANISAREVVVHGRVEGNVNGTERVELKKSCVLTGDITTQRVMIEDGAFFKGSIDLQKEAKPEPRKAVAAAAGASGGSSSSISSSSSSASAPAITPQASLLEQK